MKQNKKSDRRSYHHGDLRTALLEAVIDLVREESLDAVTMRSIARRSGVSESAAYYHFASKADLLGAAAALAFEGFAEALGNSVESRTSAGGDPAIGLAEGYVSFALTNPGQYQLIFGRHIVDAGIDTRQDARAAGGASIEVALTALARSLDRRNSRVTAEDAFPMVRAILHGVVALVNENELDGDVSTDQAVTLASQATDALLDGLAQR